MDFEAAVQSLSDSGVEFIIIGEWSAVLYGSVHVTKDLEVYFSRKPANLQSLVEALAPYRPRLRDAPPRLPFVWEPATLSNGTIFTLMTDLGPIDLLAEVRGLGSFEDVQGQLVLVEAFGRHVRTLDLKSLIESKRAVNREKDIHVLHELETLLEAQAPPTDEPRTP